MPDMRNRYFDIDELSKDDFIHPLDATEHGYRGVSPETDRDQYTVAGVTGGTAKASDRPDPDAEKRMKSNTEALRGSK